MKEKQGLAVRLCKKSGSGEEDVYVIETDSWDPEEAEEITHRVLKLDKEKGWKAEEEFLDKQLKQSR